MVNLKPFLRLVRFPNFKLKFKLGVLLLCLMTLSNYQPAMSFPPVKSNVVYAEITQEQTITPQSLPVTFQLPHPGYQSTPFSNYHPGIDIATGLGFPVKPIAKGTVVEANYNFWGLGLVVEVDHGSGYRSLYAHLGKIYVEKGKEVDENSFVGEVGLTGHTSGPHTHLEVFKDGIRIDPRLILPEIRNYPKEEDFASTQSATPSAVIVPSYKPASGSAQVNWVPSPSPTPDPSVLEEKINEVKEGLKQENLNGILNVATPKPSTQPIPQGGKVSLSLKNFTLFGFKK